MRIDAWFWPSMVTSAATGGSSVVPSETSFCSVMVSPIAALSIADASEAASVTGKSVARAGALYINAAADTEASSTATRRDLAPNRRPAQNPIDMTLPRSGANPVSREDSKPNDLS